MRPDDVCEMYGERPIKITIRDDSELVIIEGNRESLEFLSELFRAQAAANDDGFEIAPNGPGSYFFDSASEKGIYIHRVDR